VQKRKEWKSRRSRVCNLCCLRHYQKRSRKRQAKSEIRHWLPYVGWKRSPHVRVHSRSTKGASEKQKIQIRSLDRHSQGEAEKRVVAGARVLLRYYETARAIRQYKHDYLSRKRKDLRKERAASFTSETMPYFYDSPVTGWVEKYPFLRASIKDSPDKLGFDFIERPGGWDPDKAVRLLWRQARNETNKFAQWINGQASTK